MFANTLLILIIVFCFGSMFYAYKIRGVTRYENLSEYLRKGWPIFTPFNCLLYLFTPKKAKPPFIPTETVEGLKVLEDNWEVFRDEALTLLEQGSFDSVKDKENASYYDVGFRTFYKYGWSKFYLNWYGHTHESAQKFCPKSVELLKQVPAVNGAMFSILPPGSQLTRHLDPFACSLRYHLGLKTPEMDECYISVDGEKHSWRDGKAVLFDVTYLHYARNDTDKHRVLLMCDIERPMNWFGSLLNLPYKFFMRLSLVPNMEGDKRGFANKVFQSVVPLLSWSKGLKERNLLLYKLVKYLTNTTLIVILGLILWLIFNGLQSLFF
jgi:beta-hydroxylase